MEVQIMNQPCTCQTDPYTWIVDDPIDGLVICFGCRSCGAAWTRIAPEPMQKLHARTLARKGHSRTEKEGQAA